MSYAFKIHKYLDQALKHHELGLWFICLSMLKQDKCLEDIHKVTLCHSFREFTKSLVFSNLRKNAEFIKDIYKKYIVREKYGIWVEVVSFITLREKDQENLKMQLKKQMSVDNVFLTYSVDQNMLGGLILNIHGLILDASLSNKIKKMIKGGL